MSKKKPSLPTRPKEVQLKSYETDDEILIIFSKGKQGYSKRLVSRQDPRFGLALYEHSGEFNSEIALIATLGKVGDNMILRINMQYHNLNLLTKVVGLVPSWKNIFDTNWQPLSKGTFVDLHRQLHQSLQI